MEITSPASTRAYQPIYIVLMFVRWWRYFFHRHIHPLHTYIFFSWFMFSTCRRLRQGSHFCKLHVFSRLFWEKSNEIAGKFAFDSVFALITGYNKDVNQICFVNAILKSESWNTEFTNFKFCFSGLESKFQVFPQIPDIFQSWKSKW